MLRNKAKLVVYYLFLTYGIQSLLLFYGLDNNQYNTGKNFLPTALVVCLVGFFALLTSYTRFVLWPFVIIKTLFAPLVNVMLSYRKLCLFFFAALSVWFFWRGLGDYRYDKSGIQSSLSLGLLIFIGLKGFVYMIAMKNYIGDLQLSDREKLLVICASLFAVSGVTSSLSLFVLAYTLYYKNLSTKALFLLFSSLPVLFIIGLSVKLGGVDNVKEYLSYLDLNIFVSYLASRFSISLYTLMYVLGSDIEMSGLSIQLSNLGYRLNVLLGDFLDIARPEYQSISRLNYVLLLKGVANPQSGTSPGLIGGMFYLSRSLGILLSSLYLGGLIRCFTYLGKGKSVIIILLISFVLYQSIWKAIVQSLLVFDASFISLVFFCSLMKFKVNE